jgi:hypothetical protein
MFPFPKVQAITIYDYNHGLKDINVVNVQLNLIGEQRKASHTLLIIH